MAEIVLVEDAPVLRRTLAEVLERGSRHVVRQAETAEEALAGIGKRVPDLLITDHQLPGDGGKQLLRRAKQSCPDLPVIVITGHGTIEDAVAAMRGGASDYLRKPIDVHEFELVVQRCLERVGLQRELHHYRRRALSDSAIETIVGESHAVKHLRALLRYVAGLEKKGGEGPTVLLTGETGTGKGLTARALHRASARRNAPFIEVNCTAVPDALFEAELLGYEQGAFTDAAKAKAGLFEAAEGGTIFFDEVAHVSPHLQAKLLKIIDEKVVRRLGSTRARPIHATIVAATHVDLEGAVSENRFREDLYHRLNVLRIGLPPLREREDDARLLAQHFMHNHAREYGVSVPTLSRSAATAIRAYGWPGNVRELSHAIERAMVTNPGVVVDVDHLALDLSLIPAHSPQQLACTVDADFADGPISLDGVEATLLRRAMEFTGANRTQAARLLGLSRHTLRYRLKKHNLS